MASSPAGALGKRIVESAAQLALLRACRNIAIVGMSADATRPVHDIGFFLRTCGLFESTTFIHPTLTEVGGVPVHASLTAAAAAGVHVDLANLFVAPSRTISLVEEAHRLGIAAVWFQPGAESEAAIARAIELGLTVVGDGACTFATLRAAGVTAKSGL